MFKHRKSDKKSIEELIYEKYGKSEDKSNLKRDELYKILNTELSKYYYSECLSLTPLNIEILMNNIGEIENLLSNGHDINEKNKEGLTPLVKL